MAQLGLPHEGCFRLSEAWFSSSVQGVGAAKAQRGAGGRAGKTLAYLILIHPYRPLVLVSARVWDAALPKRKDVLAVAQPGAGKTLAYLLTMAARLMGAPAAANAAAAVAAATAAEVEAAGAAADGDAGRAAAEAVPEAPPAPQGLVLVPTR